MNYTYFSLSVGIYLLTFVPMWLAGISPKPLKPLLLVIDGFMTAVAYVFLWYSTPGTWYSLGAVTALFCLGWSTHQMCRGMGYDPYETSKWKGT